MDSPDDHMVNEILSVLRTMLEADGYDAAVRSFPSDGNGRTQIKIIPKVGACPDCLVPKDMMKLVIADRLPGLKADDLDLIYPSDHQEPVE